MPNSTDLTVNLPAETEAKPAKLSRHVRRDPSALGAEAIADYVARELAIVEAIERRSSGASYEGRQSRRRHHR